MKSTQLYLIYKNFFSPEEIDAFLWHGPWVEWSISPKPLGKSYQHVYGQFKNRFHGRLPRDLKIMADKMATLIPQQRFTTAFLRKYEKGQGANPHRDPKSFIGFTAVSVFGEWKGAETVIEKYRFTLAPGDVLVQRCHVKGKRRPLHRLSPVTKGTRYSLIINSIV